MFFMCTFYLTFWILHEPNQVMDLLAKKGFSLNFSLHIFYVTHNLIILLFLKDVLFVSFSREYLYI